MASTRRARRTLAANRERPPFPRVTKMALSGSAPAPVSRTWRCRKTSSPDFRNPPLSLPGSRLGVAPTSLPMMPRICPRAPISSPTSALCNSTGAVLFTSAIVCCPNRLHGSTQTISISAYQNLAGDSTRCRFRLSWRPAHGLKSRRPPSMCRSHCGYRGRRLQALLQVAEFFWPEPGAGKGDAKRGSARRFLNWPNCAWQHFRPS